MLFQRRFRPVIGLDNTTSSLKLIELTRSGDSYRVESYAAEPSPPNAINEKAIVDAQAVGEAVRRAVKRAGARSRECAVAVSGDGDTGSIGFSQFKNVVRRNVDMVYIIENNGVYGLTKGQFSATAEKGLALKKQGTNPYMPVDICMEAVISNATFVARSFAGNPK